PKVALAILSGMEAEEFVRTVRDNDLSALVKMPGIGKKTAERLLVEMRDRLSDWNGSEGVSSTDATPHSASFLSKEAETALQSLGFKPQQASRAVASVLESEPEIADSETLIRLALKGML
ncbi:MAG TPA: Holliday junction branch migration protein RuvA, partial [Gammaproteobacteria bacterium]|nr:Holliday junction branch migration protein RuvA [Gammaproteobacteria bacterium]